MPASGDLVRIAQLWSFENPRFTEITAGTNNVTYRVDADGRRAILRIYPPTSDLDQVQYEHRLLQALAPMGLSFAVPVPMPAPSGDTLVPVTLDQQNAHVSLFPMILGDHPDMGTRAEQRECGRALGELDQALAAISLDLGTGARAPFGFLDRIDPILPAPRDAILRLPLEPDQVERIITILDDLHHRVPVLYAELPQQIVHRDYDASNVLMRDGRVTGVLDFEFAGQDLRATDLTGSLALFRSHPWQLADGIEELAAFADGYGEVVSLSDHEIEAIPTLMLLRGMMTTLSREARRRRGLAQMADVVSRARELLRMEAWLEEHGERLVEALRA